MTGATHAGMAMSRYKHLIGPKLRARGRQAQRSEVAFAIQVLNRMIRTAKPVSGTVLNRAQYPSDVVVLWRLRYKLALRDLPEMFPCAPSTVGCARGRHVQRAPRHEGGPRVLPLSQGGHGHHP